MRKRAPPNSIPIKDRGITTATTNAMPDQDDPRQALLGQATSPSPQSPKPRSLTPPPQTPEMENLSRKSQWIVLAIASGACAAANGVFAKLTTTELTTSFATWVANLIGLSKIEGGVEVVVRIIFFLLNLLFNGIMWALFTKALKRGTSTTQVSILNTSSNFMITALLGFLIFSEELPPLWFAGAALLVCGNVIIGRREEGEVKGEDGEREGFGRGSADGRGSGEEDERLLGGLGEVMDLEDLDETERERSRKQAEDNDILHLDTEEDAELRNDLQLM